MQTLSLWRTQIAIALILQLQLPAVLGIGRALVQGAAGAEHQDSLANGEPCAPALGTLVISFANASVIHNNFGGLGPDFDAPPTLHLANVGIVDGRTIDLEVSNLTSYLPASASTGDNSANGLTPESDGVFGRFGVRAPPWSEPSDISYVELRFSFYDAGAGGNERATARRLTVAKTHFSLYDVDQGRNGGARECIGAKDASEAIVGVNTTLGLVDPRVELFPDGTNVSNGYDGI